MGAAAGGSLKVFKGQTLVRKVVGRVVVLSSTSPNDLRVTVYDPLRGVPVAELEVIKSKERLRHG
jgi:hypothetical protein